MPTLDRASWPADLARPEVVCVFVGGCVERGDGSRFRRRAHAHTRGDRAGWICVLAARRLEDRRLVLHELAHILTREGHTDRWRRELISLGGTLDQSEDRRDMHKRRRGRTRFRGLFPPHHSRVSVRPWG